MTDNIVAPNAGNIQPDSCKSCTRCGESKPLAMFNRQKRSADGRQDWCKSCNKEYQRTWREKNPQYQAEWREKNNGYHLRYHRDWRADNRIQWRALSAKSRAKRMGKISVGSTSAEVKAWTDAQKKVCYWCGKRCARNFHVDHYQPLAKGGAHSIGNLVISCQPCNNRKHASDPIAFAQRMGKLF